MTNEAKPAGDLRERFVSAALELLREHGPAELTVRRVAEAAGSSTMGVYSQFGGRAGVLGALYARGFELLCGEFASVPVTADPVADVLAIGTVYRRFALANPPLYAFLFERPLPDFDPSAEHRTQALAGTFEVLVAAIARATATAGRGGVDPQRLAYLVWGVMHGLVSLELTHAGRSRLPGWIVDGADDWDRAYRDGVNSMLDGLRLLDY